VSNTDTVATFIDAFNNHDLDAFAMTLHPEVELHAGRGLRVGVDLARVWATRAPGGLQQRIAVEHLREAGDRVAALIVREWWWHEEEPDADVVHADEMAWLFEFRDGLISSWKPFDDRDEALAALTAD
jgi:ketosteroid isomerase-like protein